jgi:asparagine synthase (glutamine-hydrolysing)
LEHLAWQVFANSEQKQALYNRHLAHLARAGNAESFGRKLLQSAAASDALSRRQWADIHLYLPDDILTKVDRASMAVSLEARSPFLDYKVVEFAARIPARYRMNRGTRKLVLKRAVSPLVPAEILGRRKEGFSIPMKHWLRQELRPMAHDLLASAAITDYFDRDTCSRLLAEHESGRFNHAHILWTLMVFAMWRERPVGSEAAAGALV